MPRFVWLISGVVCLAAVTGCRCCPCFEHYAGVIDHCGETSMPFDSWYHPRLDISREGKPDWCGPINCHLSPCKCYMGSWKRYDACWLYPPRYPYLYPGNSFYGAPDAVPQPSLVTPPADVPPAPEELLPPPGINTLEPAPLPELPKTPPEPPLPMPQGRRPHSSAVR